MKKRLPLNLPIILIIAIFIVSIYLIAIEGCNRQIVDLNYSFNYADIEGVGKIQIKSWCDYGNSDMIQVTGVDGTVYLTHSSNVILISK